MPLRESVMSVDKGQPLMEACDRFVTWLDRRVVAAGRGDGLQRLEVAPSGTFWLGRLSRLVGKDEDAGGANDDRSDRLDPCAMGIRLRPAESSPWSMTVTVRARAWVKDSKDGPEPDRPWWRTGLVEEKIPVVIGAVGGPSGPSSCKTRSRRSAHPDYALRFASRWRTGTSSPSWSCNW